MSDKSLEAWNKRIEAICPGPSPEQVVKMRWGNEWRYYQYLAYTNKNGMMWDRVSINDYEEYLARIEKTKHLTLKDL